MITSYTSVLSGFHNSRERTHRNFHAALRASQCSGGCLCGGGRVEVDGSPIDLYRMPEHVLMGAEPTAAELAAARVDYA